MDYFFQKIVQKTIIIIIIKITTNNNEIILNDGIPKIINCLLKSEPLKTTQSIPNTANAPVTFIVVLSVKSIFTILYKNYDGIKLTLKEKYR